MPTFHLVSARSAKVLVPLLLVIGLGAACGSDDAPQAAAPAATPGGGGGTLTIEDFAFSPESLQAKVGDTLTVKNSDSAAHTATSDDDRFDTGTIAAGDASKIELDEAGTFTYHCDIHEYMKGTIEVTD